MVIRKELVEGMYYAMAKGQTLRQAMMSFYNAGYPKADIEEAAKYLQSIMAGKPMPQSSQQPAQPRQPAPQKPQPVQTAQQQKQIQQKPVQQLAQKPVQQPMQRPMMQQPAQQSTQIPVKKKGGKMFYIIMISLLVILLGALIAIVIFREQLVEFFADKLG